METMCVCQGVSSRHGKGNTPFCMAAHRHVATARVEFISFCSTKLHQSCKTHKLFSAFLEKKAEFF